MPTVTVGLARGKVSYYCPQTKINLSLANPYAEAYYTESSQLKGIVKSILSATPTLVYYDGEIPADVVQAHVDTFAIGKEGKDFFVRDHARNVERRVPNNNISVRAQKLLEEVAVKTGGTVQTLSIEQPDEPAVPPAPPIPPTPPVEVVEETEEKPAARKSVKKAADTEEK